MRRQLDYCFRVRLVPCSWPKESTWFCLLFGAGAPSNNFSQAFPAEIPRFLCLLLQRLPNTGQRSYSFGDSVVDSTALVCRRLIAPVDTTQLLHHMHPQQKYVGGHSTCRDEVVIPQTVSPHACATEVCTAILRCYKTTWLPGSNADPLFRDKFEAQT